MRTPDFLIQCRWTGIFFVDLYLASIVVSHIKGEAMRFTDEAAAQRAIDLTLRKLYPSFGWRTVAAEG